MLLENSAPANTAPASTAPASTAPATDGGEGRGGEGRPLLPLTQGGAEGGAAPTRLLVLGPTAHSVRSQTGGWSAHWQGLSREDEVP